ncbi:ATP-binding protein [Actinacidiphila yeochonensis]|uniref:ATP-binding protein n=1 Tax=Actinacidiphila yeochonensis TaxID=89050 RepID=UPI0006892A6F|nr:ATP-binding protein [Actinacidiphila yeochonensis]
MSTPAVQGAAQSCLYVTSIRLTAVLTAVGAAREFVRRTLGEWRLGALTDSAELMVSELVTNAVKSSGPGTEPGIDPLASCGTAVGVGAEGGPYRVVGVQLRAAGGSLYVEVWDRGAGAPVLREQTLDAEGGRGLFLVDMLSSRWDVFRPAAGGKVVWAELPLDDAAVARPFGACGQGADLPERAPWTAESVSGTDLLRLEQALTQRVLDGLAVAGISVPPSVPSVPVPVPAASADAAVPRTAAAQAAVQTRTGTDSDRTDPHNPPAPAPE